jgi:hypothetical protein
MVISMVIILLFVINDVINFYVYDKINQDDENLNDLSLNISLPKNGQIKNKNIFPDTFSVDYIIGNELFSGDFEKVHKNKETIQYGSTDIYTDLYGDVQKYIENSALKKEVIKHSNKQK